MLYASAFLPFHPGFFLLRNLKSGIVKRKERKRETENSEPAKTAWKGNIFTMPSRSENPFLGFLCEVEEEFIPHASIFH